MIYHKCAILKKSIIGFIEDITAFDTVRMTGDLNDIAMMNKPVNNSVSDNSVSENVRPF